MISPVTPLAMNSMITPAKRRRMDCTGGYWPAAFASTAADAALCTAGQEGDARPPPRDCYEEVLGRTRRRSQQQYLIQPATVENPAVLHSNWFHDISWMRYGQLQVTDFEGNCGPVQDEIKILSRQLLQVKRRLGPAAERCAETYNASIAGSLSTTTGHREFAVARSACNPYEILGEMDDGRNGRHAGRRLHSNLFINRSAIKLANIDAILGFQLTRIPSSSSFTQEDAAAEAAASKTGWAALSAFRFVDLCGAPGGFSEYIMKRSREVSTRSIQGYGMSLMGSNDQGQGLEWGLDDYYFTDTQAGGRYLQYKICAGADGTGDIYKWDNVNSLREVIYHGHNAPVHEKERGRVHLVVADGGCDAQRDSEDQEGQAQKLVVCQVAAALSLLQRNGSFVIKMFGFQTVVIRAVMRDIAAAFESVGLLKPVTSRPASAERYVVCLGFRGLEENWDAQKWRDRTFLGQSTIFPGGCNHESKKKQLDRFLDQFDRDMLSLNLKACFEILSYLENKCRTQLTPESDQVDWGTERAVVNVEAYKHAWQLV